ncbi:hypothetical protein BH20CHL7_BH20CHL7_16090 [soil metagenome]
MTARRHDLAFTVALAIVAGIVYCATRPTRVDLDGFVPLADALLHGRLHIGPEFGFLEHAPGPDGGGYMPYPPAPVLFVLPFVALFGPTFDQGIAAALVGAANVVLLSLVFRRLHVKVDAARWLLVAFALGSVHWWAAGEGSVWLFAHVSAVFFALAALLLALHRTRPLLAGMLLGLAAASRVPLGFTIVLYAALYGRWPVRRPRGWSRRRTVAAVRPLIPLGLGFAIPVLVVMAYNVARFGSPAEFGYNLVLNAAGQSVLTETWYAHGINSLAYIPRNLNVMLLQTFDFVEEFPWFRPNWIGTSLILTTPILLWLLRAHGRNRLLIYGWIAVAAGLALVITHGGIGWTQFGYRRILDVAPILWPMLGWVFRDGMSREAKLAVGIGVLVNAYGIWAIEVLGFVSF